MCKKNLAIRDATGIMGGHVCMVARAVDDEITVNGTVVKYHLSAVEDSHPQWLQHAAPEITNLWYARRFTLDVLNSEAHVVEDLTTKMQGLECVLMECFSGMYHDEDTLQSDIIHEGISQKIQVRALKELLPMDLMRLRAAVAASQLVQQAAAVVCADALSRSICWLIRCWLQRLDARSALQYRRQLHSILMIQQAIRHWLWRQHEFLRRIRWTAAVRIQRWLRRRWDILGYRAWRRRYQARMLKFHAAATHIQAVVRGWEYRRFFEPHFGKRNVRRCH
jgi:hypothetical protein